MVKEQRLELIQFTGFKKSGRKFYKTALFQCSCGGTREAYWHNVQSNRTTSCGCKDIAHAKELHKYKKVYGGYKSN
jgi:hypothetical protein